MESRGCALIIDDDENVFVIIGRELNDMGFLVETASNGEEGLARLSNSNGIDLILMDQNMPGMSGMETLKEIRRMGIRAPIIMMTAYAEVSDAVSSIKLGAYDYLRKPVASGDLKFTVDRAMKVVELERENRRLKEAINGRSDFGEIIYRSKIMERLLAKARSIANLDSTVMISGESGTGKELLAKAIHKLSGRKDNPFIAVNCAALPEDLLNSALFGYEKGAFTGAVQSTKGCFEEAHGGTLFLDEIGDMSPRLQSSLLRILQEKEFVRLGSYKTIKADFRLITATNKSLKNEVSAGRFREDLYYRLNVIPLGLPALRERKEDIPLLTAHFINKMNARLGKNVSICDPQATEALTNFYWKGNCRELENVMERVVAMVEEGVITYDSLPDYVKEENRCMNNHFKRLDKFSSAKEKFEKAYLEAAFAKSNGNIAEMARITGIPRPNVYKKLKKYGMTRS